MNSTRLCPLLPLVLALGLPAAEDTPPPAAPPPPAVRPVTSATARVQPRPPALPSAWSASLALEAGRDTNVVLLPEDADAGPKGRMASLASAELAADYRLVNAADRFLRVGLSARDQRYRTQSERNLQRLGPTLGVGLWSAPLAWAGTLAANRYRIDQRAVASEVRLQASLTHVSDRWLTIGAAEIGYLHYRDDPGRTALIPSATLRGWWLFEPKVTTRRVDLGLKFTGADAHAEAHSYRAVRPSLGVFWRTGAAGERAGAVDLAAGLGLERRYYRADLPGDDSPDRQTLRTMEASVDYWWRKALRVGTALALSDRLAFDASKEYDRALLTVRLLVTLP